jgi:hypothetical protein
LLVASCGQAASPGGVVSPGGATPAATVAATASPPPTPRPSPLVSAKGAIVVREPASGESIVPPVRISGDASVFEANVEWRVVTTSGAVLAKGFATASAGAPARGTFGVEATFERPYYAETGFVEVFERSAKDGTITEIVRVPVSIAGNY